MCAEASSKPPADAVPAVHVIHWQWQTGKHNLDLHIKAHAAPVTANAGGNVTHRTGKHTILSSCVPGKNGLKLSNLNNLFIPDFLLYTLGIDQYVFLIDFFRADNNTDYY